MTKEAKDVFFFLGFFISCIVLHKEAAPVLMLSFALLFLKQWKEPQ